MAHRHNAPWGYAHCGPSSFDGAASTRVRSYLRSNGFYPSFVARSLKVEPIRRAQSVRLSNAGFSSIRLARHPLSPPTSTSPVPPHVGQAPVPWQRGHGSSASNGPKNLSEMFLPSPWHRRQLPAPGMSQSGQTCEAILHVQLVSGFWSVFSMQSRRVPVCTFH